jgi:hypothetical protein
MDIKAVSEPEKKADKTIKPTRMANNALRDISFNDKTQSK